MAFGCVICTEDFGSSDNEDKTPMCIKGCGHVFHKSCLSIWLTKSSSCPVCRNATLNTVNYVTKLHFQRLSMDNNNSLLSMLDETDKLRDQLKQKDVELSKKNAELKQKDLQIKAVKGKFEEALKFIKSSKNECGAFLSRNQVSEEDESVILVSPKEEQDATAARTRARQGVRERAQLNRPVTSGAVGTTRRNPSTRVQAQANTTTINALSRARATLLRANSASTITRNN